MRKEFLPSWESLVNLRGHGERLVQHAGFDNLGGNWKTLVYQACFDKCISKFMKYVFGMKPLLKCIHFIGDFSKLYAKTRFSCLKVLVSQNEATYFESWGILSCILYLILR